MNPIVMLTLFTTISLFIFMIIFLTPYFSKKQIKSGKFDALQFINLFLAPILIIPTFYYIKKIIMSNPHVGSININQDLFNLIFLAILYFLILGNGIHSVTVILSKHMKKLRKEKVWQVNEFFHNEFSHLLITASAAIMFFFFIILELNRPLIHPLSLVEIIIQVVCGVIIGIILGIGSTEGSIPKSMFYIFYILSLIVSILFIYNGFNFRLYPFSIFMETVYIFAILTLSFYKYKIKGFPEMVGHIFFDE
jgi:hypothetical protein